MENLKEVYIETFKEMFGDSKTEEEIERMAEEKINEPKIPANAKGFYLNYFDFVISSKEVKMYEEEYSKNEISCVGRNKSGEVFNSIEELFNSIRFHFPPELVSGILLGALGSGFWQVTIDLITTIRNKIAGKSFDGNKPSIVITAKIDGIHEVSFIFPNDMKSDEVNEIVTNFRETLKSETKKIEDSEVIDFQNAIKVGRYVSGEKNWKVESMLESIKKKLNR